MEPLKTIADLKHFFDSKMRTETSGTNYSLNLVQLDGREALSYQARTIQASGMKSKWFCSICFFWEQNPDWEKSIVCTILVDAETRETLNLLKNSLRSVKVRAKNIHESK
jgi:hypothetical protein